MVAGIGAVGLTASMPNELLSHIHICNIMMAACCVVVVGEKKAD
jgi:hypothetical protein